MRLGIPLFDLNQESATVAKAVAPRLGSTHSQPGPVSSTGQGTCSELVFHGGSAFGSPVRCATHRDSKLGPVD
jgi:hypothetical protein